MSGSQTSFPAFADAQRAGIPPPARPPPAAHAIPQQWYPERPAYTQQQAYGNYAPPPPHPPKAAPAAAPPSMYAPPPGGMVPHAPYGAPEGPAGPAGAPLGPAARLQALPSHAQRTAATVPRAPGYPPFTQPIQPSTFPGGTPMAPEDIPARIASANAALAAIHSVTPPAPPPEVKNNPKMALTALPQLPGGDIRDEVVFSEKAGVAVVDELTAQKSAAEFSRFVNEKRRTRHELWELFWTNRLDLDRRILREENECFVEAQEEVAEYDREIEGDGARSAKLIAAPFIVNTTGSFDIPPPPPVVIPDPEEVMRQYQHMHAQAAQQAHVQAHAMRQSALTRRPAAKGFR